ncbi:hypothetical protein [Bradyrhizobium sp.]|jgi:hypothetical protein|uniref:hypothetical protein n=1 Tax=Bradyrhizobium sp. TaxID=376 RepID=UPI002BB86333|nr:hypothetical protein [Bradyrhizobium sp.]HMM90259.1 hypothetical protein [Bradyrhizobium sp.]
MIQAVGGEPAWIQHDVVCRGIGSADAKCAGFMQCISMFSNKFENRSHAFASNFVFYNFRRIDRMLIGCLA